MSPLVQRTAVSVPLRFARRVAARWRRLPGADPSRFVRDRLGGRFGPVDVGLSAPERVYAWARFGGRALSFAWHLQVGLSVVVQPVLRGPAALASLLLARSEHVLVRETGRPSTGAPGIARSFAAPPIPGPVRRGRRTTAAGSLAEARLAGALLPTAMPTLVPEVRRVLPATLLSPPPPVRTRHLLAAEARVGSARRAAGPAPSPSWLSPEPERGRPALPRQPRQAHRTGPTIGSPVSTMLAATGPVSPRPGVPNARRSAPLPLMLSRPAVWLTQARLVPLPARTGWPAPPILQPLPSPIEHPTRPLGGLSPAAFAVAGPGRVARPSVRQPAAAGAPSRTVVRPADELTMSPLPYVFSPPARSLGAGPPVVEPQVVEQQVVAVVRREVHELMEQRPALSSFSRGDYVQIADQVYSTLVRRLVAERERLGLRG